MRQEYLRPFAECWDPDWNRRAAADGTEGTDIHEIHLLVEVHGEESKCSASGRTDWRIPGWLWRRSRLEVRRQPPEDGNGMEEADVARHRATS